MGLKTSEHIGIYIFLISLLALVSVDGSCTFPSYLNGVWFSSNGGTLTFDSTSFANFKISDSIGKHTFTCHSTSGSKYLSVSEIFYHFNLPFVAYICMDLRYVTSSKYIYYQPTTQLKDADYNRMKVYLNNTVSVTDINTVCELTDYTELMYHLMVKNNTISSQKIDCPSGLQGVFNYTYDSGSGNECTGDTDLNVCDDVSKMKFNYTQCSAVQAYSAGGEVNCVYSSTVGTATLLHVYNLDTTTDESTYFRFTCYVIDTVNNTLHATQYPKDCHYNQNATFVNSTGASLVFSKEDGYTCTTPEESTALAYIAIIIVVILLLLIIIIAIIFLLYMWKKKKDEKKRKAEEEERRKLQERSTQEKIDNPDLRPEMDLGLPDDSKYNIDRLMYSDDKMVTPSNVEIERLRAQGFEGFDGFDDEYMDEFTRQNMIDASVFLDKRQRLDPIDEYEGNERDSASFMKRFKELARSRMKRRKRKGKSKSKKKKKDKDGAVVKKKRLVLDLGTIDATDWESDEDGEAGEGEDNEDKVNIPGQVEVISEQTPPLQTMQPALGHRNANVDRRVASEPDGRRKKKKKKKKKDILEDSDDEQEEDIPTPRLILPNLRQGEAESKKTMDYLAPIVRQPSLTSEQTFSSIKKARVNNWTNNDPDLDLPIYFEDPKLKDLPPLQRVNRKKNQRLWSDILAKYGGDLQLGNDPTKMRMSENRWRLLLEELYTDKKYFDYMKKSARNNPAERDVVGEAKEGLGYLQSRACFWKEQEPIPARPPSYRPPSYRSHSFALSTHSPLSRPAKKSKSFVSSQSEDYGTTSRDNTDFSSGEQTIPRRKEKSNLSREKSKLSKEKSNLHRENSMVNHDRISDLAKPRVKREKSFLSDDSPKQTPSKSPYDNSKEGTPRPKKIHLPKIDDANKIYKMDALPKTPLTQVRIDIDREESMI